MLRLVIAQNIKQWRLKKGWSQQELAQRAGYTDRSTIASIEKGRISLSYEKMAVFADLFGTTVAQLSGADEPIFKQMGNLDWFFVTIGRYAIELNEDGLHQIIDRAAEVHEVPKYRIKKEEG